MAKFHIHYNCIKLCRSKCYSCRGVTLVELLIAIVLASFVIIGALQLFQGIQKNYAINDQVNIRNQNVQYAMKKLCEAIGQAGASLDSAVGAIVVISPSSVKIVTNPSGGIFTNTQMMPSPNYSIPVDDHKGFMKARYIFRHPYKSSTTEVIAIDTNYNVPGEFVKGIDTAEGRDSIRLDAGSPRWPLWGEVICAIDTINYFLSGTNLYVCANADTQVFAENIDSLSINFLTIANAATNDWATMSFASITIRGRTAVPDPKYTSEPDGYRRLLLNMTIPIKSRIK